jgi:hypothetical protein
MAGTPGSFLDKLQQTIYLDYVLKVGGVIMLAIGVFQAWQHEPILTKFLILSGPIAWYVGDKFTKIYRK